MYDSERFEISKMIGRHTRTNKHTHTHTTHTFSAFMVHSQQHWEVRPSRPGVGGGESPPPPQKRGGFTWLCCHST